MHVGNGTVVPGLRLLASGRLLGRKYVVQDYNVTQSAGIELYFAENITLISIQSFTARKTSDNTLPTINNTLRPIS